MNRPPPPPPKKKQYMDVMMWKRGVIAHYVIIKILSDVFLRVILYVFGGIRDLFEVKVRELFGDSQDISSQIVPLCT